MKTAHAVEDGKLLPNELLGGFYRRVNEILRRITEGTLDYQWVMNQLQKIVEGCKENNIIRIDRSVPLVYPPSLEAALHPEFEKTGPAEYDISKVLVSISKDQISGECKLGGIKIYNGLIQQELLSDCLNLRDLEEIQKRGVGFFQKYFGVKTIYGWKSVVKDKEGRLQVPCLCVINGSVALNWYWVTDMFHENDYYAHFVS